MFSKCNLKTETSPTEGDTVGMMMMYIYSRFHKTVMYFCILIFFFFLKEHRIQLYMFHYYLLLYFFKAFLH